MDLKVLGYFQTDEFGNPEWDEGCLCEENVYDHAIRICDYDYAQAIITSLQNQLSNYSWTTNPESMGR